jgi:putative membrane protein
VIVRFLVAVACNVAAIFVASVFIDGVDYGDHFWTLVLAGVVFALVNAIVKPIVTLLALPAIVLTLGVALFFVNLLMLYITSWIVGPFEFASFGDAVLATIVVWLVNVLLAGFRRSARRREERAA